MKRRGQITQVNPKRAYALILGDDGQQYFFHCTELKGGGSWQRIMRRGRIAEFDVADNSDARKADPQRRDRALNVTVLL